MTGKSVLAYYGEGNGKSSAALGKAILVASNGGTATVIQFLKSKEEGEIQFLTRLEPELKSFRFAKSDLCFDELGPKEKEEEIANLRNGFHYGKKVVTSGASNLVVMDELLGLIDKGIIQVEEVKELILAIPEDTTVIFTGRVLTPEILELVDEAYCISREK